MVMRNCSGSQARIKDLMAGQHVQLLVSYRPPPQPVHERAPMSDTVIQPRPFGHPLAGQQMSGARMIMQVLADEGVTAIFGYSGGAILPTYDGVFLYNEQQAREGEPQIP